MHIHFGVDYYPEHWPETRWETDAVLMQKMGIQVVRMAEFSWHKLEPEEGKYDFTWLDRVIALLGRYNIRTVLGTPTAAPPAWMVRKHPQILPIDQEGRVRGFGGRHHDCQSNETYRDYCRKIVTQMAGHYADNEYVIGWQPDNELGNSHQDLCTCDSCRDHFQTWLEKKYQSVDVLNRAWGNAFWSQEYNSFQEIGAPRITVCGENPSMMLDWKRFCSDLIVDFLKEQTDIIRKYCPNHFITHNYMGFADTVNYYDLGELLDFVSHDQYPGLNMMPGEGALDHAPNHVLAATLDVVRSYKNRNFWIMEQQSGITGWQIMGRSPEPGQLSLWTAQSVAHGADAIVYFRWRVCAFGTEQYWHGILPHSGIPGRRYEELSDTIHKLAPVMEQMQTLMPKSEAGIVFSFDQDYAFAIQPNNPKLRYTGQLLKYYKALYNRHIPVDFVPDTGDFEKYKLLIAPLQYLMTPELEEKYFTYVRNGGHLILTMRCGVKDHNNINMTDRELPGRLSELAGVEVIDYDSLFTGMAKAQYKGEVYDIDVWSDILRVNGEKTEVLAEYASEYYKWTPCVTVNPFGKGACIYIGTEPGEAFMQALMDSVTQAAAIAGLGEADADVELMERQGEITKWLFVMNHSNVEKKYAVSGNYEQVYGCNPGILQGYEVHIYKGSV